MQKRFFHNPNQSNENESLPTKNYTVAFVGDPGVGKTALLKKLCTFDYNPGLDRPTMGFDKFTYEMPRSADVSQDVKLEILDVSGAAWHKGIYNYCCGSDIAILVFDITNRTSFENLKTWMAGFKDNTTYILLGNKYDMKYKRAVRDDEIGKFIVDNSIYKWISMSVFGDISTEFRIAFRLAIKHVDLTTRLSKNVPELLNSRSCCHANETVKLLCGLVKIRAENDVFEFLLSDNQQRTGRMAHVVACAVGHGETNLGGMEVQESLSSGATPSQENFRAGKNFLELLQDLAAENLKQVRRIMVAQDENRATVGHLLAQNADIETNLLFLNWLRNLAIRAPRLVEKILSDKTRWVGTYKRISQIWKLRFSNDEIKYSYATLKNELIEYKSLWSTMDGLNQKIRRNAPAANIGRSLLKEVTRFSENMDDILNGLTRTACHGEAEPEVCSPVQDDQNVNAAKEIFDGEERKMYLALFNKIHAQADFVTEPGKKQYDELLNDILHNAYKFTRDVDFDDKLKARLLEPATSFSQVGGVDIEFIEEETESYGEGHSIQ